ncbi:MAG: hypothetical protein ACK5YC_20120 [Planctomyces sp.]
MVQRQVVEIGDFPWPPPGLSGGRRGQLLWSVCILAITGGAWSTHLMCEGQPTARQLG